MFVGVRAKISRLQSRHLRKAVSGFQHRMVTISYQYNSIQADFSAAPAAGLPVADRRPVPVLRAPRRRLPAGNERFGPKASLAGRAASGRTSSRIDGWRMYHGSTVPGFRRTRTVASRPSRSCARGRYIDHSDSLGAAARFGRGDVQWLTAGRGIVHCEMFPLLSPDGPNTAGAVPDLAEPAGQRARWWRRTSRCSGAAADSARHRHVTAPAAPPRSRLHRRASCEIDGAQLTAGAPARLVGLPARGGRGHLDARDGTRCARGPCPPAAARTPAGALRLRRAVNGRWRQAIATTTPVHRTRRFRQAVLVTGPEGGVEILLLQGRPIGEPVAQYGPFVMNTEAEIQQAFADYRRTGSAAGPGLTMRPSTGVTRRASRAIPTAGWSGRQPMLKRREPTRPTAGPWPSTA
jgi:hypothetical protein